MKKFNVTYLFIFSMLAIGSFAKAQEKNDSLFIAEVTANTTKLSSNLDERASALFNGKVHNPHVRFKNGGHAYFMSDKYTDGTVILNGVSYNQVNLMYDIVRNELVLLNIDQTNGIVLQSVNVDSFMLHQHHFINIKKAQQEIKAGYYDILYKGGISLLAKREKEITEKIDQKIEKVISEKTSYFLLKDAKYHPVKGKGDLLKLLQSTNTENLAFIKEKKLNFKKDLANAMVGLIKFHDSFNK